MQACLSGIPGNKDQSVAILSDNGIEFKNKVLNEVCEQLGIKSYFLTHSSHKVMYRWKLFTIC